MDHAAACAHGGVAGTAGQEPHMLVLTKSLPRGCAHRTREPLQSLADDMVRTARALPDLAEGALWPCTFASPTGREFTL
jgi:hypothetical protein